MKASRMTSLFNASTPIAFLLVLTLLLFHDFNVLLFFITLGVSLYLFRYQTVVFIVGVGVIGLYFLEYRWWNQKLLETTPMPIQRCEIRTIPQYTENEKGRTVSFTCKARQVNFLVRLQEDDDSLHLKIGDVVEVKGEYSMARRNTVPYLFNYQQYLLSQKIRYVILAEDIIPIHSTRKPHYRMINDILSRLNGPLSSYQLSLLIGHKHVFSEDFQNDIQYLNISHLFVVSGFHVTTLAAMLRFLLRRCHVTKESSNTIINVILFIYLAINNFQPSILRAVLLFYGVQLKKHFRLPISTASVLSFIFLLNLLHYPFIIYHVGFQLSYLVTFILILSKDLLHNYQHRPVMNHLMITLVAQTVSLPIVANFTFQYNVLSLLLAPIFLLYFNWMIFPLTILSVLLPCISNLLHPAFDVYERMIDYFSSWQRFTVTIGGFDQTRRTIYYLIWYLWIRAKELKRRGKIWGVYLIFIIFFYHRLTISTIVAYIDVGQGDATYIQTPFQRCTMLIDTGGSIFPGSTFHPGERHVLPYLIANGIHSIDYLIVSHGDQDHIGDYRYILDTIDVQTILFSAYDESERTNEIKRYAEEQGISYQLVKQGDTIFCGPLTLNVYSPQFKTFNTNDSSLVFTFSINDDLFLFTGDVSSEVEHRITPKLPSDITFLKVSHHGSKSSTSDELLKMTRPKYAMISVGQNYYGHPSEEVLRRLKAYNCQIYTTQEHGTIVVKYFFHRRYIIPTIP